MRKIFISTLLAGVAFAAQPALAAKAINPNPTLGATPCGLTDITPTALKCVGWYEGNLNGGDDEKKAQSATALNALLGVNTYSGATLTWLEGFDVSGSSVDFAKALFGETVVSFHVGAANGEPTGVGYSATAFYKFDAGNLLGGLDLIGFNRAGLSNARLYYTGEYTPPPPPPVVPEPATWAMMLAGLGTVGYTMRRRRNVAVSFA